jgi:hypothetical protein
VLEPAGPSEQPAGGGVKALLAPAQVNVTPVSVAVLTPVFVTSRKAPCPGSRLHVNAVVFPLVAKPATGAVTPVTETWAVSGWEELCWLVLLKAPAGEVSVTVTVTVVGVTPGLLDEIPIQKIATADAEIMATMMTAAAGALMPCLRPKRADGLAKVSHERIGREITVVYLGL